MIIRQKADDGGPCPGHISLGSNCEPKSVELPEPSPAKLKQFARCLTKAGIEIREKDLRGITIQ